MKFEVELGSFNDNAAVLAEATYELRFGSKDKAFCLLNLLYHYIAACTDTKSKTILLPQVEELIAFATVNGVSKSRTPKQSVQGAEISASRFFIPSVGGNSVDPLEQFKARLFNAAILVAAVAYTHGLLTDEVMKLSGLGLGPVASHVLAGAAQWLAIRFIPRGG